MHISDLLFSACGETKKGTKRAKNKRTIPSSCNSQKVCVYYADKTGVYKYLEKSHEIELIKTGDYRKGMCRQKFFINPPFILLYVATKSGKSGVIKVNDSMEALLVGTEIGAMSQNVSLYCSANELSTTLIALNNVEYISDTLGLKENEVFIYSQVVGYPKKKCQIMKY